MQPKMSYLPAPTPPIDTELTRLGFLWYGDLLCIRETYIAYVAPQTVEVDGEKVQQWFSHSENKGRISPRNQLFDRSIAVEQAEQWTKKEHWLVIGLLRELDAAEDRIDELETELRDAEQERDHFRDEAEADLREAYED